MENGIYIGIDQSYRCTGVTIIDGYGVMLATIAIRGEGLSIGQMIATAKEVSNIVSSHVQAFDHVTAAIEQPAISAGGRSSSATGQSELSGAIQYATAEAGARVTVVSLSSWKSKIARNRLRGFGKTTIADRAQYLQIAAEILGYEHDTPDQADAHMIAEYQRQRDLGLIDPPKKAKKKARKSK